MLYFANPTGDKAVHEAIAERRIGFIDTPLQGNKRPNGVVWCADNGCYNDKKFHEDKWWSWLESHQNYASSCIFATAPDVKGDAKATIARSTPWLSKIRALGYPAAFVAQDGSDVYPPPWDEFDVLFIGGSDEFKTAPLMRQLVGEAKARGKWVHYGRCNSKKRYRFCEAIGCDSVDGTYLVFGPTINLPKLLSWLQDLHDRPALFSLLEVES